MEPEYENAEWYEEASEYSCAFCGKTITHDGFDPCQVTVEARRWEPHATGMWVFWVHAECVPLAFTADLREEVGDAYGYPAPS